MSDRLLKAIVLMRASTVLGAAFLVLALAQPGAPTTLVAGAAILATAGLLATVYVALQAAAPELTVGSRSHQHREVLSSMAAPRHPNTAGRPRTRAPSLPETAA